MVKAIATVRGDSKVITISWSLRGNDPNSERGFHIHEFGDNTNGCTSAGPHYRNSEGIIPDGLIKLNRSESIIGRTIVIHAGCDDLGRDENAESKRIGNAGARPACGKSCR
ncbi:hypothetical protein ASPBRDRAFT_50326 [Aspergillus brasiliensis CBS 101740]|uniref:Superoxide dismutase [Cu-Zn] n=1 Tax=Aspergillus brasiliensis (strain CBS 101740 / IMI 381727 / IBT 21946) TaxID=767769 RepID=A0A1L9V0K8_ASPBC|nr:hypothetical protein ASPBRDRAFT_50326 [Aspergillus brasiliensis CBS 101740]